VFRITRQTYLICGMMIYMANISSFFNASTKENLKQEIMDDIEVSSLVPKRFVPYFRHYGCGISVYENEPLSAVTLILMKAEIAAWISQRNSYVTGGENGSLDKRAVTSQSIIEISQDGVDVNVQIPYVVLSDTQDATQGVSIKVGGK